MTRSKDQPPAPKRSSAASPSLLSMCSTLLRGWLDAVLAPDHHRRVADLAVGDPADLVVEVPLGQLSRLAELADARSGHQQLSVTVDPLATVGARCRGDDLMTVPQVPESSGDEPGRSSRVPGVGRRRAHQVRWGSITPGPRLT